MLRYRLAPFWRRANNLIASFCDRRPGFRAILLHDISSKNNQALSDFLNYLVQNHEFINPDEAASFLAGSHPLSISSKGKLPCLLTFDDGFTSNLDVAVDILERYNIKGLFFVSPGLIDLSASEQRKAIKELIFQGSGISDQTLERLRLMSWAELAQLKMMGHTIGCHGMRHRRLSELDETNLYEEIFMAGDLMDKRLDQTTDWYAFAFGDIQSISKQALKMISKRYRFCRSGIRRANYFATPTHALCADAIDLEASLPYQCLILEGGLDFLYTRKYKVLRSFLDD